MQGWRSTLEYMKEFYRLITRNNFEMSNKVSASYLGRLKKAIQDKLEMKSV